VGKDSEQRPAISHNNVRMLSDITINRHRHEEEKSVSPALSRTSKESSSSSSSSLPPPPLILMPNDVCILQQFDKKKELNGVSVKLIEFLEDSGRWKAMITSGRKAGDCTTFSPLNLEKMQLPTKQRQMNKQISPIEAGATKIALLNLQKSTTKSHVIYKLEKSFGVRVVYCSNIIQNPYDSKTNFLPKLELQAAEQVAALLRCNEFCIDKQPINIECYQHHFENYKQILSRMSEYVGSHKKVSIAELYQKYKEESFEEKVKMSLLRFCQLIEHHPHRLYVDDKNVVRLVRDQKLIATEKISKMVEEIFDSNGHILAHKWNIALFKEKWAQRYKSNLTSLFGGGKYRSYLHFLNDIQSRYRMDIRHNRKKHDSDNMQFTLSLR